MEKTRLELFRGTLDILILKSLIWGPLHGYAITGFIRHQSDDALLVEEGTLYPALLRMEQEGWITSKWGPSEKNRKAKFYSISSGGRKQLARETREWERMRSTIDRFLGSIPEALGEEAP